MAGPFIAVWSPKGGTGKTLISAGLAMHLVRRNTASQTLLIDLDAGGAHIAPLLQVSLRPSVLDYAYGVRTAIHPSGLHVLAGPARLVDAPLVTAELTQTLLEKARAVGYLAVIDLDSDLRDSTLVALEKADAVLLLTTPDLLSLYACRRFTQEAELIGLDLAKFRLVINRATARTDMPEAELIDLVGLPLAGKVPSLPGLAAAVNRGMMSATGRSNTDFAVALQQVADGLQFAGVPDSPLARLTSPVEAEKPVGLIGAVRRWWRSL
ncbi:MAG: minD2 [Symbiobacteriaceae bacterium]|nr:minD2 [Symbiobacteriaceae bacterium]